MDLSVLSFDKAYFQDLRQRVNHNYMISEFYNNMFVDSGDFTFYNKSRFIDTCSKFWDVDYYRLNAVKDIKRVNLCHDKFCFNCQSLLALKRQLKFAPVLDDYLQSYKIVHMVVTVPNCSGDELLSCLDRMYLKFPYMLKFFKGQKKVAGINFLKYGYRGCVRGLEVTYNNLTCEFHPHFHCMVIFRPDLDLNKYITNSYSFDGNEHKRYFSDLEILLQKVWFLLFNDCRVTSLNINQLREGYSVICDDSEGHYHEVFKYACKGAFYESKGGFLYNESVFRYLYFALKNRRMIQGYGVLHSIDDTDDEILDNAVLDEYNKVISFLREIEDPLKCIDDLDYVLDSCDLGIKYISKSSLKRLILERRRISDESSGIS